MRTLTTLAAVALAATLAPLAAQAQAASDGQGDAASVRQAEERALVRPERDPLRLHSEGTRGAGQTLQVFLGNGRGPSPDDLQPQGGEVGVVESEGHVAPLHVPRTGGVRSRERDHDKGHGHE